MLNCLYGKMGMSPYLEQHAFVDDNELNKFIKDKKPDNTDKNKILTIIISLIFKINI